MLQKAFFKVDVVDRIYDTPVFVKTTPGAYEFTIPGSYNYVVVEYAGAGGGYTNETTILGGKGSIKKKKHKLEGFKISGVVGSAGGRAILSSTVSPNGGTGYKNGDSGQILSGFGGNKVIGGGGGGSTSVIINNSTYEASAGAGSSFGNSGGGKGGGQYGGTGTKNTSDSIPGNNATDPDSIGYNSGNGYVKIWAGYDPYLK